MGIEYYLVCDNCKEYIDLHKCHRLNQMLGADSPPKFKQWPADLCEYDLYWHNRALWFMGKHFNHSVRMLNDDEAYYEKIYVSMIEIAKP